MFKVEMGVIFFNIKFMVRFVLFFIWFLFNIILLGFLNKVNVLFGCFDWRCGKFDIWIMSLVEKIYVRFINFCNVFIFYNIFFVKNNLDIFFFCIFNLV